jgi:hypothetical protein
VFVPMPGFGDRPRTLPDLTDLALALDGAAFKAL